MTEANGDYTDYGYDNVYELTSEVMKDSGGTTIYSISWTYDNVGDRATQTKDGNQTSYTYNNMNQMSAAGNTTFTYDSNGNTASKTESQATTNYNWDYENRLAKIDNPSGDDYVYEYDGDGMRVRSGHDSGQGNVWDTRFYYDAGGSRYSYLFESDDSKNVTVADTIDPYGDLISQRRGSATSYHLYDKLGSTRQLVDSSQTATDTYSYYAFGEVRSRSGSTLNRFAFAGATQFTTDNTGLIFRRGGDFYSPSVGRALSPYPHRRSDRGAFVLVDRRYYVGGVPSYGFSPPLVPSRPSTALTNSTRLIPTDIGGRVYFVSCYVLYHIKTGTCTRYDDCGNPVETIQVNIKTQVEDTCADLPPNCIEAWKAGVDKWDELPEACSKIYGSDWRGQVNVAAEKHKYVYACGEIYDK
jgi:YD repeat-containing protein